MDMTRLPNAKTARVNTRDLQLQFRVRPQVPLELAIKLCRQELPSWFPINVVLYIRRRSDSDRGLAAAIGLLPSHQTALQFAEADVDESNHGDEHGQVGEHR